MSACTLLNWVFSAKLSIPPNTIVQIDERVLPTSFATGVIAASRNLGTMLISMVIYLLYLILYQKIERNREKWKWFMNILF
ncbi:hypothetical protein XO26_0010 [Bacillus phage phi4B1]|uniref:hypothetical protein n=1 Tax=Bacillus phage phi4B1 TaxID=1643324 RepID=UPI0006CE3E97|nr:hypothetical protein XO26_0010 [Bacillus phage phi4B1]ALF02590.1 hypothetical protein XO26_0010 [Bacillus phage phi4B1]